MTDQVTTPEPKKKRGRKKGGDKPLDPRQSLRHAVKYMYDIQELRIQFGNRAKSLTAALTDSDKEFLDRQSKALQEIEDGAQSEILRLLRHHPIYVDWLSHQRGVGDLLAGVMLSSFDIVRAETVSRMWSFAGLGVVDGRAARRVKGVKAKFDPWVKTKVGYMMPTSMVMQVGLDDVGYYLRGTQPNPRYDGSDPPPGAEPLVIRCGHTRTFDPKLLETAPVWQERLRLHYTPPPTETVWRKFYDDYKHRKEHELVSVCMGCQGTGKYKMSEKERERFTFLTTLRMSGKALHDENQAEFDELAKINEARSGCTNCGGTGGPAPWGRSGKHRHFAALRYCAKMFLIQLYREWRAAEGLPVRDTWAEAHGHGHHFDPGPSPTF